MLEKYLDGFMLWLSCMCFTNKLNRVNIQTSRNKLYANIYYFIFFNQILTCLVNHLRGEKKEIKKTQVTITLWVSLQIILDRKDAYPEDLMGLVIVIFDSLQVACVFLVEAQQ